MSHEGLSIRSDHCTLGLGKVALGFEQVVDISRSEFCFLLRAVQDDSARL